MARYFEDAAWELAYVQTELPDDLHGFQRAVKAGFDRELVGVTPTEQRFNGFNGVNYGGKLYVNLHGDIGFIHTAGHELYHQIETLLASSVPRRSCRLMCRHFGKWFNFEARE
jgi:hypothetical protein